MPLTDFQRELLATVAPSRTPESYLAGGAALHISPNSLRYSHALDFFHDSAERVAAAFSEDRGRLEAAGYALDLAVNKCLALAGRDEARDLVDILYAHDEILPLGSLVWAAVGKDPGFTPLSLLEQLKRTGRYRPEEIERLDLAVPFDLVEGKERWLAALADAERFVRSRPTDEIGCLYYSEDLERFESPTPDTEPADQGLTPHFGRPGGILPRPTDQGLT